MPQFPKLIPIKYGVLSRRLTTGAAAPCSSAVCVMFSFYALACVFNGIPIWPPPRRGGNAGFIGGLETVQMALGALPLQARNVQVSHREKMANPDVHQ